MMQFAFVVEGAVLDGVPHLPVGIPEGDAGLHEAVHLLHAEGLAVDGFVHEPFRHGNPREGEAKDVQAAVQLVEHREIYFLEQLHVPEIARREVAGDVPERPRDALDAVAMAPDQFEDVRILLLWHDAGAGGEGVRQVQEPEVLAGEQAAVIGQPADGLRHGAVGPGHHPFAPSPGHLRVDAVVVQRSEAQELRRPGPVERGR